MNVYACRGVTQDVFTSNTGDILTGNLPADALQ